MTNTTLDSNNLIIGKWYKCKQWNNNKLRFKFTKKVGDVVHCLLLTKGEPIRKHKFIPYYYYTFSEVATPKEAIKPVPKYKRYGKKKVGELLDKIVDDVLNSITSPDNFNFDKWKQDNL